MEESRIKPSTLASSTDYTPALLWLMADLGQAQTADVLREFEQRLGDLIPPEHRERITSGSIRWNNYVRWSRQALVGAGLMGSGGLGVWTITAAGRKWLREHPDGGKGALLRLARERRKDHPEGRPRVEETAQTIRLAGESFALSQAGVVAAVRAAIAQGLPPEARRFNDWYLEIDGEKLSAKWVIALVTGLSRRRFDSPTARRQLRKLGLEAQPVEAAATAAPAGGPEEVEQLTGEAFMRAVLAHLGSTLPEGLQHPAKNLRANYLGLKHRTPRTWYEVWLHKKSTVIWLAYYAPEEKNRAWAESLQPHVAAVEAQVAQPLQFSLVKSYAGLRLLLPRPQPSAAGAQRLAADFLRFIQATLPILDQMVAAEAGDLTRGGFYQAILDHLSGRLPATVYNRRLAPNRNYLQLTCPLPGAHYEIVLRNDTEVGLHFESSRERNLLYLDRFQGHLAELQSGMGEPVQAERWGNSCARVYVKRPHCRLDTATAQQIADIWLRFIEATLPVVDQAATELGLRVKGPRPAARDLARPQAILADKIRTIRAFLDGNHSLSPNDELLCEWVQFCYTFELYAEGAALFKLVRPAEVNQWLYERTRKLAQACRFRANG